jgi:hypothetical protein
MNAPMVALSITLLQGLWLSAIILTGAAADWRKPALLLVWTVVAGLACWGLPDRWAARVARTAQELEGNALRLVTFLCLLVVGTAGVFAFHTNHSFSDEGYVLLIGRLIANQGLAAYFGQYADLPWLGRQHPPLMPLVYSLVARATDTDLLAMRSMAVLIAAATAVATWALAGALYGRRTALIAPLLLVAFVYFHRVGTLAMLDGPLMLCTTVGMLLALEVYRHPRSRDGALIGAVIGTGLLIKYAMVLMYPLVLAWTFVERVRASRLKVLALAFAISAAILGAWLLYAWHHGVLDVQLERVGRHATWGARAAVSGRARGFVAEFILTRLPSAVGLYLVPIILSGLWMLARRRETADLRVLSGVVLLTLPFLLTTPDPRYMMPAFPLLAIAAAAWLRSQPDLWTFRLLLLVWANAVGMLYLFWDWKRQALLFL